MWSWGRREAYLDISWLLLQDEVGDLFRDLQREKEREYIREGIEGGKSSEKTFWCCSQMSPHKNSPGVLAERNEAIADVCVLRPNITQRPQMVSLLSVSFPSLFSTTDSLSFLLRDHFCSLFIWHNGSPSWGVIVTHDLQSMCPCLWHNVGGKNNISEGHELSLSPCCPL